MPARHVRRSTLAGGLAVALLALAAQSSTAVVSSTPTAQWIPNDGVHALATDGTYLYVGGEFTSLKNPKSSATQTHTRLARINLATGIPDPVWTPVVDGDIRSMTLDPTQTVLYVGGAFSHVDTAARAHIAAVSTQGSGAVTTWNPGASNTVYALTMAGTDVLAGGSFLTIGEVGQQHLAEIDSSGALVRSFRPTSNGTVRAISQPPGANFVVVGGQFTELGGQSRSFLGAVTLATGALTSFNPINPCVTNPAEACLVFSLATTATDYYAAVAGPGGRLEDYSPTTGNRKWNVSADGDVQVVALVDGTLYAGGHFGPGFGSEAAYALAAVNPSNGALITSFTPHAANLYPGYWALLGTPEGLVAGGDATAIAGTTQRYLTIFPAAGGGSATSPSAVTMPTTPITVGTTKVVERTFSMQISGVHPTTDNVAVHTTLAGTSPSGVKTSCTLSGSTDASYVGGSTFQVTYRIDPQQLSNACSSVELGVTWTDANNLAAGSHLFDIALRRAARYEKLNASPEPVKKGAKVTTKAVIQRASWDDRKYHAYDGQKSELQFRTTKGSYGNVKAVIPKTAGKLSASSTQTKAGCWRYTFAGTSITAPATATGDCVALR
jgi:hypothetical protein